MESNKEQYDWYEIGVQYAERYMDEIEIRLEDYKKNYGYDAASLFLSGVCSVIPTYSKISTKEVAVKKALDGSAYVEKPAVSWADPVTPAEKARFYRAKLNNSNLSSDDRNKYLKRLDYYMKTIESSERKIAKEFINNSVSLDETEESKKLR